MLPIINSSDLESKIIQENYLLKVIMQLNKDFQLSNLDIEFNESLDVTQLQKELYDCLVKLIENNYDDYLNLLYRIDVSEKDLIKVSNESLEKSMQEVTFYVLKREYQKVWLKTNFENLNS